MSSRLFVGQVAIITGAGQGIGFEIARQLCLNGASAILNDVDAALAQHAAAAIEKQGGICHAMTGDAADVTFINQMTDEAVKRFGGITIAIANAGITLFGDFFEYKQDALQRVMNVNLGGSFFLAQAAGIQMKKQGGGGSILLMSSVTGHQAHPKTNILRMLTNNFRRSQHYFIPIAHILMEYYTCSLPPKLLHPHPANIHIFNNKQTSRKRLV